MISSNEIDRIEGATAYDSSGTKVGDVGQLYLDDQSGEPTWVTVNTGWFGTSQSFVPLQDASFDGDDIRLGYDKDRIKDAPRMDADQHIDHSQEDELYRYYGLEPAGRVAADEPTTATPEASATSDASDTTGTQRTDEASVTLSEERLDVGKESQEAGRARLRKYTTTEQETVSVPVTKEKLVVERQPASGEASAEGIEEGEQAEEITLREERAVVDKETVPVEEVRVAKEQVTEEEQVSADVRREHVDVDTEGDVDAGRS